MTGFLVTNVAVGFPLRRPVPVYGDHREQGRGHTMFNVLQSCGGEWAVIATFASYQTACRCAHQIDPTGLKVCVRKVSA